MKKEKLKIAIVSGYFNPIHSGHLEYFRLSRELADKLVVIVNNDKQTAQKSGKIFMPCEERIKIVDAIRYVDYTYEAIDKDGSVCDTIRLILKHFTKSCNFIFCNGGDRKSDNIPEYDLCNELGVEMAFNLGEKIQSSSRFLKNYESR